MNTPSTTLATPQPLPLTAWLNVLAATLPPTGIVLVGAGHGTGALVQWLAHTTWPSAVVEGDATQHPHLQHLAEARAHLQVLREVVAPSPAPALFHHYSNPAENGLLALEPLQKLWPQLSHAGSAWVEDPITVDQLVATHLPQTNWLILDCNASAELLQGAAQVLPQLDVLICRQSTTETHMPAAAGLRLICHLPGRHPSIGHSIWVRDVAHETQTRQQEAAAKAEALKQRDELAKANAELKQTLEQAQQAKAVLQQKLEAETQAKSALTQQLEAETQAQQQQAAAKAEARKQRDELAKANTELHQTLEQAQQVQADLQSKLNAALQKSPPPFSYLFSLETQRDWAAPAPLYFNATRPEWVSASANVLGFHAEGNSPLYLVSTSSGNFTQPGSATQLPIDGNTAYILSGCIAYESATPPQLWLFQHDEAERIDSNNLSLPPDGRFRLRFTSKSNARSVAVGIRVGGQGLIQIDKSRLYLREDPNPGALGAVEEKLLQLEKHQAGEVQNAVRQIESFVRLQQYLGADVLAPDMHNWPVSPDFAVLLIQLIEQHAYDAVIEFGSGSSTVVLARALKKVAQRMQLTPAPLLSFDHLPQYQQQTIQLLNQAGLQANNQVALAPLVPWESSTGQAFHYYDCGSVLAGLAQALQLPSPKILVVVDGPPASTGPMARYPALAHVLEFFGHACHIHFLMDDYLRADEQSIVTAWQAELTALGKTVEVTTYNKLEKKACLLQVS